jgi:hypothetical protein
VSKKYFFIIANEEGKIITKKGILHPEKLSRIFMIMQISKKNDEAKIGYLDDKFCKYFGYKKREDTKTKLLEEQLKMHQEKIQIEKQHTNDSDWSIGLSPYENQDGEIGYLLSLSQYYLDALDRLGIRYNQI